MRSGRSGGRAEGSSKPLRGPADEAGSTDAEEIPYKNGSATRQRAARPSSSAVDAAKMLPLPSSPSSTGPVKIPFAPMLPSRTPSLSARSSGRSSRTQIIPRDEYFTDEFHAPLRALFLEKGHALSSEDKEMAGEMVMAMLISSPFWHEAILQKINYVYATYLVKMLQLAGCIAKEDDQVYEPATNSLLEFYRSVVDWKSKQKDKMRSARNGNMVDMPTSRVDHRGFPIVQRKKVTSEKSKQQKVPSPEKTTAHKVKKEKGNDRQTEWFPPPPPSSSSSSSSKSPIPSAPTVGAFQDSDGPDDSDSSDSSGSNQRGKRKDKRKKSRAGKKKKGRKKENGEPDDPDSSDSSDSTRRGKRKYRGEYHDSDKDTHISIVKSILAHFAKSENKWSGPKDYRFTTEDFISQYTDLMNLLNAPSWLRLSCVKFALKGDALDEYNSNFGRKVKLGEFRNAPNALKALGKSLETSEYKAIIKHQWTKMTLADTRDAGDTTLMAFGKPVRRAQKLQRKLGADYKSDSLLCDFYRRALQNESFWANIDDSADKISSKKLQRKIELAIAKEKSLLSSKRGIRGRNFAESLAAAIDTRRWGQSDRRRLPPKDDKTGKNPKYRDGSTMLCTGCGSPDHFFGKCTNPDKVAFREKRLAKLLV